MYIITRFNFSFNTFKCTSTNKKNILSIYWNHFLIWMFSTALWGNKYNSTFKQFKEALLYTFTRNVSCNRRIISFTCNFIYFINKYNSPFSFLNIIISCLKKSCKNTFNIFADISRFSKNCSIYNSKWYIKKLSNSSCNICFTCSCSTN